MNKQIKSLSIAGAIATIFSSSVLMADSIVLTNPANGHKYQYISKSLTWTAARDYCKNNASVVSGYLATITSQAEQDFIVKNNLNMGYAWLGGSNNNDQGVWKWEATGEEFNYTAWLSNEPNIAKGHYVTMFITNGGNGGWYISSAATRTFICEWGGSTYNDYVDSAALNDMDGNTFPEIATLYTDKATGTVKVDIADISTATNISTLVFGVPTKSTPKSIVVLPDMNANGVQEIAVLLVDNITLKGIQEIRDASTGDLITSVNVPIVPIELAE